ncbi:hypothetical protein [Streptomyces venezuelae]|nr:hypothetical protein [Streptomyces venezuelae]
MISSQQEPFSGDSNGDGNGNGNSDDDRSHSRCAAQAGPRRP